MLDFKNLSHISISGINEDQSNFFIYFTYVKLFTNNVQLPNMNNSFKLIFIYNQDEMEFSLKWKLYKHLCLNFSYTKIPGILLICLFCG